MLFVVIRQALSTMLAHRRWAALTMFGIVWGTASVVLLVGWGIGVHAMVDEGMQKVGRNLVYVLPGRVGEDLSPADERKMLEFDLDDVAALRAGARRAELVGAEVMHWTHVRSPFAGRVCDVRGIEAEVQAIRAAGAAEGRLLSRDDVRFRRRVAVIGQTARRRLLGGRPALGARLNVRGTSVEVVGVLERVGTQLSRNRSETDEQVWLPISTVMAMTGSDAVHVILARPPERRLNADLKREIRQVLGARLHVAPADEEAVFIISLMDILSGFDAVFAALNVFYVILAVGTLLIGGIGVMNMMLVAVNERRREIGLRLAVGARRRDVVAQFLAETLVITGVGGGVGLGAGLLGCLLLGRLRSELVPVPVLVPEIAVLALVVTAVVGVLSGTGPAWRAAGVDPAESLRAE